MYEETNWANKRVHLLIAWSFMVRFKTHKSESQSSREVSTIKNISLGGCYFYSSIPYEAEEIDRLGEICYPYSVQ